MGHLPLLLGEEYLLFERGEEGERDDMFFFLEKENEVTSLFLLLGEGHGNIGVYASVQRLCERDVTGVTKRTRPGCRSTLEVGCPVQGHHRGKGERAHRHDQHTHGDED